MDRLSLHRGQFGSLDTALSTEWLLTNGIGGFASGTVAQANTRRYHGLLIAALRPPVERRLLLAKLEATLEVDGRRVELGCNEYSDGTIHPHGGAWLRSFELLDGEPQWIYQFGAVQLEQRVGMNYGSNGIHVSFRLLAADEPVDLELTPLCADRDYHDHLRTAVSLSCQAALDRCQIHSPAGNALLQLQVDRGRFFENSAWHWNFQHRQEASRGLDAFEHLYRPGSFRIRLSPGESVVFTAAAMTAVDSVPAPAPAAVRPSTPGWIRQLHRAAADFVVKRQGRAQEPSGTTIVAGYPWFTDWGRDTMIALPGLTLTTGRAHEAADVLRTFSRHVDRGMLPNRFPDDAGPAEYNTVDATLWYFHALHCYLEATQDTRLLAELWPVLLDIHDWHRRGTRYGIQADPSDGLLRAGEPGVQLTWMDAKIGDWVVTPRTGKAVEINALWHFALTRLAQWSQMLGTQAQARQFTAAAEQVAGSFRRRFWNPQASCLFDVIDVDGGGSQDASIRPNQIFAVSLGAGLLDDTQSRAVVDTCAAELLTPVGLRSLSPRDPRYVGQYVGDPMQRDASYHQGTVWSWLLGPFALADFGVHGDADRSLRLLEGIAAHLGEACLGQISEIFDGDAPHRPRGCFAQAWSVAETLRAWYGIHSAARRSPQGNTHDDHDH